MGIASDGAEHRADAKPLAVGLSTTTVEAALSPFRDGIGAYTQALIHELPALGIRVQGLAFPPLRTARRPPLSASDYLPHSFAAYALGQLGGVLRPVELPVDVFHCTDHHAFRTNCPCVVTVHDAVPLSHPGWVDKRLRRLRNFVLKRAVHAGDAFIAVSHFAVRELVSSFDLDPDKIHVVPNGVGDEWCEPIATDQAQAVLRQYGLRPGYFLFVGTFQPRKNLDRLLDAYLSLAPSMRRDHPLVLVGRNGWRSEQTVARLQQLAQDGEPLHWLSGVGSTQDLRALYQQALTFVFPSLHEGFGLPVLEAFASGVPVITSDVASLPEVAGAAAVLVNPQDSGQLAAAMRDMARDGGLRARCIAAGRERLTAFTWRRTAELTAAVYRGVLG